MSASNVQSEARLAQAASDAAGMQLDQIDVSDPRLYQEDIYLPYFERLRREAPVHYRADGMFGSFWSVTKFNDILSVQARPEIFSSDAMQGGITITDPPMEFRRSSFLSMDPPRHDEQRKVVSPIFGQENLKSMECLIRERTQKVLDGLPRGETFDWVERVSIELTTLMLATLFDFPLEERHKLKFWSDCANADVSAGGLVDSEAKRLEILTEALQTFTAMWREKRRRPPRFDFISMLAHGKATQHLVDHPQEFLGNLTLLLVGGNDTTRHTMSGGLLGVCQHPSEYRKLKEDRSLIPNMVSEMIRWVTPLIHTRRTAVTETEIGDQRIRVGDKVVMWFVSGNRDDEVIARPDKFIVDRERARQHMSFGFGVHRCLGRHLAELQLRILWEEIVPRYPRIELMGAPTRFYSNFVRGISSLPVQIPSEP